MRKLLHTIAAVSALLTLSMAANAADIGVRPPAYVPPPFSWTGFYIGGNIGGAWYQSNVTDNFFGLVFHNPSNNGVFIGGGQVGFNYQFSNIVLGVESGWEQQQYGQRDCCSGDQWNSPGDVQQQVGHNRGCPVRRDS